MGTAFKTTGDPAHQDAGYDGILYLKSGAYEAQFLADIRYELRQSKVFTVAKPFKTDRPLLIVARYIPKPLKLEFRENGINYLEASGNCFIHTEGLYILINDQQVTETRVPAQGKLWRSSGLKFLFSIITEPGLLNAPYRAIADHAQIALGTIGGLLDELKQEQFLKETGQTTGPKYLLEGQERLIQRWSDYFMANLRPKLTEGRFSFIDSSANKYWKNKGDHNIQWGGENGGHLLTGFLHPERHTLYSDLPKTEIMRKLLLKPDPDGNVELLKPFWRLDPNPERGPNSAPPLVVYAELSTNFDSRNRETAKRIKADYFE
ncbi:type IV toxin-antitoxin system AbiEi family antitoxin [Mucilaginibacter yixingensis]